MVFVMAGLAAAQTYRAPRTPDGKPDLNGIWQAMNTANWDLEGTCRAGRPGAGTGRARARCPRASAWWKAAKSLICRRRRRRRRKTTRNRLTLDPEVKCYLPGVPRATYMPYPFQIVQSGKYHSDVVRI